jgi:phosphate transport system substrate-binding protein
MCSRTHGAWLNLADGAADIVFLAAPTADELNYFAERGVDIEIKSYGHDGLVFMGNAANPIDDLTSAQIRAIYSGKIDNWMYINGDYYAAIAVYIRNPESGSQRLFETLVWDGYVMPDFEAMRFSEGDIDTSEEHMQKVVEMFDEMAGIAEQVLIDQYAIGYNIMSYLDSEFSGTDLKIFTIDGYAPATENFASGDYPYLTTSFVAMRADEPQGSPARMLFDWIGSEESKAIIAENSTLTVSFARPVILTTSEGDPVQNARDALGKAFGNQSAPIPGPSDYVDLSVSRIEASSTLDPDGGITYGAENMLDRDPSTAWVSKRYWMNESNPIGEGVQFYFDPPVNIARIEMINGYAKSALRYDQNSRARTAEIMFRYDGIEWYLDSESLEFDDYQYGYQAFDIPLRDGVTAVQLVFTGTFPGSRWPWDMPISEVRFMGW